MNKIDRYLRLLSYWTELLLMSPGLFGQLVSVEWYTTKNSEGTLIKGEPHESWKWLGIAILAFDCAVCAIYLSLQWI